MVAVRRRAGRVSRVVAIAGMVVPLAGVPALSGAAPSPAGGAPLAVRVSPAVQHPGGTVRVRATGLRRGPAVVRIGGVNRRVVADERGVLDAAVTVPYAVTPGRATLEVRQAGRAGAATVAARVDWRSAGRDYVHSYTNPWERWIAKDTVADLGLRWFRRGKGSITDSPDVPTTLSTDGDFGYTCNPVTSTAAKLDLRNGSTVWETVVRGTAQCGETSAFSDRAGRVWVGGALLDDATGARLNDYSMGEHQPVVYRGTVILAGGQSNCDTLAALDEKTSEIVWLSKLGSCGGILLGDAFVANFDGNFLYAVDAATGKELWRTADQIGVSKIAANGTTLLAQVGGGLRSLDPATGKTLWSRGLPEAKLYAKSAITIGDGMIFFIGSDLGRLTLYARSATDGSLLWTRALPDGWAYPDPGTHLLLANHLLYVPDAVGDTLQIIDSRTGELVRAFQAMAPDTSKPARGAIPLVVANGHLYLTSREGLFDYAVPTVP